MSDELLIQIGSAASMGEGAIVSIVDSACCYTRTYCGDASRCRRHPYQRVIPVFESVAVG